MPSDDLVLNVRQIAGYGEASNAINTDALLIQRGGLGGPYLSIEAATLVATALAAPGGNMTIGGALSAISFQGGKAQFSNAFVNLFGAQTANISNLSIATGSLGGVQIATVNDLAALSAASVNSFNGRVGAVQLWIDDIRCAGGAPIYSPRFSGSPRADTPPPWSSSTRLATTMFVQGALAQLTLDFAPIDSPNFTGVPTAPTAAVGASDGQLATTAFVQSAVAASTTGVVSFNTRTGAVVLTAADLTGAGGALLASPTFTGTPQGPTATPGTNSAQIATCAFVTAAIAALAAGVTSFNGRTGAVTLTSADVGAVAVSTFNGRAGAVMLLGNDVSAAGGALLAGPAFTGAPTAPTAALGTTTTQLATTAFVQAAVAAVTAGVTSFNTRTGAVVLTAPDISAAGGALLAGPAFSGVPTAPTATPGVATTQLATCAFVAAAVAAGTAGVASFNSRTGAVTLLVADISAVGGALLASPAFTGVPTAPTATTATSTTQLATTAFVHAALPIASTAAPLMDGTAAAGVATAWSRGDHVHPTDTSRAAASALANYVPLAGGTMSGRLTTPGIIYDTSGNAFSFVWSPGGNELDFYVNGAFAGNAVTGFTSGNYRSALTFGLSGVDGVATATYSGGYFVWPITASDRKLKQNIGPPERSGVDAVNALPVRQFDLTFPFEGARPQHWDFGLIADEVETPLPTAFIGGDANGYQLLRELPLIAMLIKAVQELTARLETLETRIAT